MLNNILKVFIFTNYSYILITGVFKENDSYKMLTSYGEYRFDVADVMKSHNDICRLMSLVMEWVERPPLVDIRVYIFLIQKKWIKELSSENFGIKPLNQNLSIQLNKDFCDEENGFNAENFDFS